jgi:hypothetical protein
MRWLKACGDANININAAWVRPGSCLPVPTP